MTENEMTNQAAQTMPEPVTASMCPSSDYAKGWNDCLAASQPAGAAEPGRYFAGGPQGHFFADDLQLARDLVNLYDKDDDWTITDLRNPTGAAPAASGAHPDALPDGTLSKSTAKRVEALAAASVSERARAIEILAGVCLVQPSSIAENTDSDVSVELALRAIEQALTRRRGAPVFDRAWVVRDAELRAAAYNLLNLVEGAGCERWQNANGFRLKDTQQWVEFYIATKNVQSFGEVTTPQPSADAVRELVKRILNWQPLTSINKADRLYQILIAAGIPFESVTDELESLLSAANDHQQNAAQGGGEK